MKRVFQTLMITAAVLLFPAGIVKAEENGTLKVDITSYEGSAVMIKDGEPYYTPTPVTFIPDGGKGCSYSISTDDGENFGGYVRMSGESLTLYPDDATSPSGRWQIRFRKEDGEDSLTESQLYRIVFDTAPPLIEIGDEGFADGWLKEDVTVCFDMRDAVSGIGRIVAKCGRDVIKEEHFKEGEIKDRREFELTLAGTGSPYNTVDITCFDTAGNSSSLTFEYRYDITCPVTAAEGIEDGDVLSEGGELLLSASDDSGEAYISYVVEKENGDGLETTQARDIPENTLLRFDRDGRYRIRIWAEDGAGNVSHQIRREFVVDATAPELSVSGAAAGADLRGPAGICVDVKESLYEDTEVNIKLSRNSPGKSENIPIEPYRPQAVLDSRTVNIKSDGDYIMEVSAVDAAGNTSKETRRFRMDATAPHILLEGLKEGEITSEKPVIRFSVSEMFYDSTVLTYILERKEGKDLVVKKSADRVMKGTDDRIDITVEEEGEYRLTCIAADRSGNNSQEQIGFTVDVTPPVISDLSGIDNRYFKAFRLPSKIMDMISDISGTKVQAYVNDNRFGDDDVIIEEGKYVLSILAEDAAGNVSEGSATFMVDHTAPQIVLGGMDADGNIKKGSMITVSLLDAGDSLKSVKFNDRNIAIGPDDTASIAVTEYGEYDLSVKAEDAAGNVTDTDIHTSCYMYPPAVGDYLKKEKVISSQIVENDENDMDPVGLAIGLLTVLSGTYGLTCRATLRH